MQNRLSVTSKSVRLGWADVVKALSILWIVFFHFYTTYYHAQFESPVKLDYFPSAISQYHGSGMLNALSYFGEVTFNWIAQQGFHAVGVFIILSGFGLTYSLAKTGDPKGGWGRWYKRRLLRLFPMYWLAHLIYLVSPFVARPEPVDYRFFLSFLGDRIYPLDMIFFYVNPAWWFFGLLLELYLVFPSLFRLLQKVGPGKYLVVCGLGTFLCRYILLCVYPVTGEWIQGAFFMGRLWEFALGMSLAVIYRKQPESVEQFLFSFRTLVFGSAVYALGLLSYASIYSYTFTDALTGTGLFVILTHISYRFSQRRFIGERLAFVGVHSYGLYLLHQPYVIYFGERMRHLNLLSFLAAAGGIIAVITLCSIVLERYVNRLIGFILDGRQDSASEGIHPSAANLDVRRKESKTG